MATSKQNESINLPDNLGSLDIASALKRLANKKGLYLRLLEDFTNNYTNSAKEIEQQIENLEFNNARRIVHTMKGVASSIGAKELTDYTSELETILFNAETNWEPLLAKYQKLVNEVIESAKALLKLNQ